MYIYIYIFYMYVYIYIHIYMCVCVCVCVYQAPATIRRFMNYAPHMAIGPAHICSQAGK